LDIENRARVAARFQRSARHGERRLAVKVGRCAFAPAIVFPCLPEATIASRTAFATEDDSPSPFPAPLIKRPSRRAGSRKTRRWHAMAREIRAPGGSLLLYRAILSPFELPETSCLGPRGRRCTREREHEREHEIRERERERERDGIARRNVIESRRGGDNADAVGFPCIYRTCIVHRRFGQSLPASGSPPPRFTIDSPPLASIGERLETSTPPLRRAERRKRDVTRSAPRVINSHRANDLRAVCAALPRR